MLFPEKRFMIFSEYNINQTNRLSLCPSFVSQWQDEVSTMVAGREVTLIVP